MVEEFGRRLIGENDQNTFALSEILLCLKQARTCSSNIYTAVPAVDDIVHTYIQAQYKSQSNNDTRVLNRNQTPVIHVGGIGPSSGKTQLLYLAAARCLLGLSPEPDGSGRDVRSPLSVPGAVVWLDLSETFSAVRLFEILKTELRWYYKAQVKRNKLRKNYNAAAQGQVTGNQNSEGDGASKPTSSSEKSPFIDNGPASPSKKNADIEQEAHAALSHIHIFRPQSTESLLTTLASLPDYLLGESPPAHCSGSRPLHLIIMSGMSSFWWQDRHDSELDALERLEPSHPASDDIRSESRHQHAKGKAKAREELGQRSEIPDSDDAEDNSLDDDIDAMDDKDATHEQGEQASGEQATTEKTKPPSAQKESSPPPPPPLLYKPNRSNNSSTSLYLRRWRSLASHVKEVQQRLRCVVLVSDLTLAPAKWATRRQPSAPLNQGGLAATSIAVQPHLPASWAISTVTVHLLLRRRRRRMPVAISAIEALEEDRRYWDARRERQRRIRRRKLATDGTEMNAEFGEDDEMESKTSGDEGENGNGNSDDDSDGDINMESDLLLNMWGCEDWSRDTRQALERLSSSSYVLRAGGYVEVVKESARQ